MNNGKTEISPLLSVLTSCKCVETIKLLSSLISFSLEDLRQGEIRNTVDMRKLYDMLLEEDELRDLANFYRLCDERCNLAYLVNYQDIKLEPQTNFD